MPELPEVETVKNGLQSLIVGKTVKKVGSNNPKSFPNDEVEVEQFLVKVKIIAVRRRAKVLMIDLSTNYTLVVHLKMTGQLVFVDQKQRFGAGHPTKSLIGDLPDKSTHVEFTFTDNSHLYFNDQRKFGWVRLIPTSEVQNLAFMQKVGPEPFDAKLTPQILQKRCEKHQKSKIKAVLLDQSVIAGVGNIYADESLWRAKLHPARLTETLRPKDFVNLLQAIRESMSLAIQKGGSTDRNYVNAKGERGNYLDFAKVFRREGLSCERCGHEIIKIRVAGRGTHICPHCQKIK